MPVRAKPQAQQPHTVTKRPGSTYLQARSAYENLVSTGFDDSVNWDGVPNYWESSRSSIHQYSQSLKKVILTEEFDLEDMKSRGYARQHSIRSSGAESWAEWQRSLSWINAWMDGKLPPPPLAHWRESGMFLQGHPKSRQQPFAYNNARAYRGKRSKNGTRTPTLAVTFTELPFQRECSDPTQTTFHNGYRQQPQTSKDNLGVFRELWRLP